MKKVLTPGVLILLIFCTSIFGQDGVDMGDLNKRVVTLVNPILPASVKGLTDQVVKLKLAIDEKGNVVSAEVVSGDKRLHAAAIAAAKGSKFAQPELFGTSLKMTGTLTYDFAHPQTQKTDDVVFDTSNFSWDKLHSTAGHIDAEVDIEAGEYDAAIKKLDLVLTSGSSDASAFELRGRARYFSRDLINALEDTEKALSISPNSAYALCTRALIERTRTQDMMSEKDFGQALAVATTGVTRDPRSASRYYERGEIYRLKGDREKALADYRKALEIDPKALGAKNRLNVLTAGKSPDPVIKMDLCLDVQFLTLDARSFGLSQVVIDSDELNAAVTACDRSIAESPAAKKYLNRGLARYYRIYGNRLSLGASLLDAGNVDRPQLEKALIDLKSFLEFAAGKNSPEDIKLANRASGELNAITGAIGKAPEPFQLALKQLNAAFQIKVPAPALGPDPDKIILEDRAGIESYLKLNPSIKSAAGAEVTARYQKYVSDYTALEPAYKKNLGDFQEAAKSLQAEPSLGTVRVCSSLAAMNTSYQVLKSAFAKIIEMKNKGELSGDPNTVKNVEAREAQLVRVQANINASVTKYGCK